MVGGGGGGGGAVETRNGEKSRIFTLKNVKTLCLMF